jgi:hypothetical protein
MITAHATNMLENMRKYEGYSRATVQNDNNGVTRGSVDAPKFHLEASGDIGVVCRGTQRHMIVGLLHVYATYLIDRLQTARSTHTNI